MEESAPLFAPHLCISIAEYETDGGEEIALPRAIAANDNVVFRRERLDDCLILVAIGILDRNGMVAQGCTF